MLSKIGFRSWLLKKKCQHVLSALNYISRKVFLVAGFVFGAMTVMTFDHIVPLWGQESMQGGHKDSRRGWIADDVEVQLSEGKLENKDGENRLAATISKKMKVFCWIMIRKDNNVKAQAVKETWGKRCDTLLFFGLDPEFSAIDLDISEGRNFLAQKTFACLTYIYTHHIQDGDWFLKADDDTFIVMENLKYFLSDEDSDSPVYFGEYFNPYGSRYIHYNSGGAGYVLSREALRRYGKVGPTTSLCSDPAGAEDKAIGYCLLSLGVKIGNTLDRFGKSRFHYDRVDLRAVGMYKPWYKKFVRERYKEGTDSISMYPISFHYLNHYDVYMMDYMIYRLRAYGLVKEFPEVNN